LEKEKKVVTRKQLSTIERSWQGYAPTISYSNEIVNFIVNHYDSMNDVGYREMLSGFPWTLVKEAKKKSKKYHF